MIGQERVTWCNMTWVVTRYYYTILLSSLKFYSTAIVQTLRCIQQHCLLVKSVSFVLFLITGKKVSRHFELHLYCDIYQRDDCQGDIRWLAGFSLSNYYTIILRFDILLNFTAAQAIFMTYFMRKKYTVNSNNTTRIIVDCSLAIVRMIVGMNGEKKDDGIIKFNELLLPNSILWSRDYVILKLDIVWMSKFSATGLSINQFELPVHRR